MRNILSIFSSRNSCVFLSSATGEHIAKYREFRGFLDCNHAALKVIAELEQLYFSGRPFDARMLRDKYAILREQVGGMIKGLNSISRNKYMGLIEVHRTIDAEVSGIFAAHRSPDSAECVLPLESVRGDAQHLAGAKAALKTMRFFSSS